MSHQQHTCASPSNMLRSIVPNLSAFSCSFSFRTTSSVASPRAFVEGVGEGGKEGGREVR